MSRGRVLTIAKARTENDVYESKQNMMTKYYNTVTERSEPKSSTEI